MNKGDTCMNRFENDDDMKIVGAEQPEEVDTAAQWTEQKANGNIDRARRLGKVLAQQLLNIQEDDSAMLLQKQMLFTFTVDTVGPTLLPDELLVETARATFFERVRELLPDFEATLHRLGAFTFYRLAVDGYHPAALPAVKIGAMFAALCGKAEDKAATEQGARLFIAFVARLEETVSMIEFV